MLHTQLEDCLARRSELESEVTGMRYQLHNKDTENQELKSKVSRLEVKIFGRVTVLYLIYLL